MTPIPFDMNAFEVRAVLDGRKTQVRRIAGSDAANGLTNYAPGQALYVREEFCVHAGHPQFGFVGPTPQVHIGPVTAPDGSLFEATDEHPVCVHFRAERETLPMARLRWRPAVDMPSWASRLRLTLVSSRLCRLHDLTEEDADAEGVETGIFGRAVAYRNYGRKDAWYSVRRFVTGSDPDVYRSPDEIGRASFRSLWDSTHATEDRWEANPMVVAVVFAHALTSVDVQ